MVKRYLFYKSTFCQCYKNFNADKVDTLKCVKKLLFGKNMMAGRKVRVEKFLKMQCCNIYSFELPNRFFSPFSAIISLRYSCTRNIPF